MRVVLLSPSALLENRQVLYIVYSSTHTDYSMFALLLYNIFKDNIAFFTPSWLNEKSFGSNPCFKLVL